MVGPVDLHFKVDDHQTRTAANSDTPTDAVEDRFRMLMFLAVWIMSLVMILSKLNDKSVRDKTENLSTFSKVVDKSTGLSIV